ncbi:hypothetical protein Tdes44962_MAKER09257 [Teratosphaeria destructans]|uniref:Uncharacterized protein n=1 Tax=Teratosphaeria destructans TaxID=418781 RepID=A0A9W7STT4_9PEZI|nr:hypothetical protein Tdes44962_MAKER09257 [Teratosphaeria destructans]
MAANGTSTPPPALNIAHTSAPADASANKRKREADDVQTATSITTTTTTTRNEQVQTDLLEVLKQFDTTPSFLHHRLDDHDSTEPSQKKARLSDGTGKSTIHEKLSQCAYASLDSLIRDAKRVRQDIEVEIREGAKSKDAQLPGRISVAELKQIQRAKAFEQLISDIISRETQHGAIKSESKNKKDLEVDVQAGTRQNGSSVLTLFGNAPTPKQLFSSMQNCSSTAGIGWVSKSELLVDEMPLPNGLAATRIVSAPAGNKKAPTFDEAFPPPYALPALNPPKVHKRSSTRDMTIKWEFKDGVHRGSKKGGYTVQPLTQGVWLGYGGADSAQDAASAQEKRKQRERALSSGAESSKEKPTQTQQEEEQARQEEALFRRAYSSFAPAFDNSKSTIPAHTKAEIWYDKVGEKRFNDVFAIDPALLSEPSTTSSNRTAIDELPTTEEEFARVVDDLLEHGEDAIVRVTSKTDVGQVLREISELLETLASHQRIRNASLAPANPTSRTSLSPAPQLASKIGKPDEPAEDETSTYHALRRELTYLILKLPPYAVAKLDGDQLAELGVNHMIPLEQTDIKGTLEEDQVARLAKYTAAQTAAGIATLTRGNSANSGQHYNTTAQRTPAIGQAANTRYGQGAQYGATRAPATAPAYNRSTSGQSQYGTPSAAPRTGYAPQPNQYTRPGAPQQSYGQSNGQQYYQRPAMAQPGQAPTGYGGYNQQYGQTPQSQARPNYAPSQPLQQFQQQRPNTHAANAVAYQTASSQVNRTASPANVIGKPVGSGFNQPPNVQPRPTYAYAGQQPPPGNGRVTPTFAPQSQTPINGFQRPPPQPIAARAASGTPQPNGHP